MTTGALQITIAGSCPSCPAALKRIHVKQPPFDGACRLPLRAADLRLAHGVARSCHQRVVSAPADEPPASQSHVGLVTCRSLPPKGSFFEASDLRRALTAIFRESRSQWGRHFADLGVRARYQGSRFRATPNQRYVNSEDIRETGYTYVMPKNILKTFICISVPWTCSIPCRYDFCMVPDCTLFSCVRTCARRSPPTSMAFLLLTTPR